MDILARFSEKGCFLFKFESKSLVVQHGERWQLKNRADCHLTKKCSPPNLLSLYWGKTAVIEELRRHELRIEDMIQEQKLK